MTACSPSGAGDLKAAGRSTGGPVDFGPPLQPENRAPIIITAATKERDRQGWVWAIGFHVPEGADEIGRTACPSCSDTVGCLTMLSRPRSPAFPAIATPKSPPSPPG